MVVSAFGTQQVKYYTLVPGGLHDPNGPMLLNLQTLNAAHEEERKRAELAEREKQQQLEAAERERRRVEERRRVVVAASMEAPKLVKNIKLPAYYEDCDSLEIGDKYIKLNWRPNDNPQRGRAGKPETIWFSNLIEAFVSSTGMTGIAFSFRGPDAEEDMHYVVVADDTFAKEVVSQVQSQHALWKQRFPEAVAKK